MKFWYGILRDSFGKVRSKRMSDNDAPTQTDFLTAMEYKPSGDVVVELFFGDFMDSPQFKAYVQTMYQSDKRITLSDLEKLVNQ